MTGSTLIGIGDVPGCSDGADPTSYLRHYGATVLRVIVNNRYGANGEIVPCVQAAAAAGFRVNLVFQYANGTSPADQAAFAQAVLPQYAPYLWAVSIGNEQDLTQNGIAQTAAEYSASWRAIEPVVASTAPNVIRVAGEISPWGMTFLRAALTAGLPGVQAIAGHPYDCLNGLCGFAPGDFVQLARSLGLQAWFTEGLDLGPGSWGAGAMRPLAEMAGATVADAWLGHDATTGGA